MTRARPSPLWQIAHELEDQPEDAFIPSGRSPDCVLLVVSGANNAGVSTVFTSMTTTPPLGAMGRAFGCGDTHEIVPETLAAHAATT